MGDWFIQIWQTYIAESYISNRMLFFRCWELIVIIVTIVLLALGYLKILPAWILIPADIILILRLPITLPITILFFVMICGVVIEMVKKL